MKDERVNFVKARMTVIPRTSSKTAARRLPNLVAALAGIGALLMGTPLAHPQNAAQRAALARLYSAQSGPHPENAQPNGVEATTVPLLLPYQIAFDSVGNIYIADSGDDLVREINVDGVVNTVAGNGTEGYGGDNGPATSAILDTPTGIAVDSSGNLYIADTNNNRIREVSGGIITTIAGTGAPGYSGDGGPALSATLASPGALAIDSSGNLYIADSNNNCIRKISAGQISTFAGDGFEGFAGDGGPATSAMLDTPLGVAVDAAGNVYIADTNNQRVRLVTAGSGNISTIAGTGAYGFTADGPALAAALANPSAVAVNSSGTVYIADSDNQRIRTLSGGQVTTIAGGGVQGFSGDAGSATSASLNEPRAVTPGSSEVLFSDTENNRVRLIDNGNLNTVGGSSPAGAESLQIAGALTTVYGAGTLTANFSNNGKTASGAVTFYDGEGTAPLAIGAAPMTANVATISTSALPAGMHYIVASYGGDAADNPISSGVFVYTVTPAPLSATAGAVNLLYGQAIPALTGSLAGVLPQDAGKVTANFSVAATSTSNPGSYPIAVALTGAAAGNYAVTLAANSGNLTIAPSPTTTRLQLSTAIPVFEAPITLTATITAQSGVTAAGTVNFYNGSTLLNSTPVAVTGGVASLTTSALPVGALTLTAIYSGNLDFVTSTSALASINNISPDFNIAATPPAQTVIPTQTVSYALTLTPVNPTFVYPVTLTASGLPNGVTATLSPSSIAAGAGATPVTLTLNASASAKLERQFQRLGGLPSSMALALLFFPLAFNRRFRRRCAKLSAKSALLIVLALVLMGTVSACGGGGGFFGHPTDSYTVTVTAVSGPNTHTSTVTLTVQ